MKVFHVRLHVYESRSSPDMLRFPGGVVYECLEPLGVGEKAVKALAFWRVFNALCNGGTEVGFGEEGVSD